MPKLWQKGFSLVELMVALVIGLIVMAAVIEVFINARQMYRIQESKSRLQENGRFASQLLEKAIMTAGYRGCGSRSDLVFTNTLNTPTDYAWNFEVPLEGHNANVSDWTPTLDAFITSPLAGSDVITIRGVQEPTIRVEDQSGDNFGSGALNLSASGDLAVNDVVLASDCLNSSVFEITAVNNGNEVVHEASSATNTTPGNATAELGKRYENAQLNQISTKSFYLRNNDNNQPSLYRRQAPSDFPNNQSMEMVQGVEGMQVTYGVDDNLDGVVDQYVDASVINGPGIDWADVVSVELEFLLVSLEDNLTLEPQEYVFAGQEFVANDNRIREIYTKSIALRNRLP